MPEEKLLGDWIVCVPGFTLEKYRRLQRSRLSIFSRHCYGSLISNFFGLPFRSPFVNLSLGDEDFVRFMRAPRVYLEYSPHFERLYDLEQPFPVLSLGDIILNMKHYTSTDEAVAKWNERKTRINWYNLLAIGFANSEKILEQFDELPYGKKVCFVSFKSDLDSAWYINPDIDKQATDLRGRIDSFGGGKFFYYDLFDMLLYGKKTPLIEM